MIYRAIGVMSGSSLDGIDIAFAEFQENAGKWTYDIKYADCYPYSKEWIEKLRTSISLPAIDYQLLHVQYGHYIGQQINRFIESNGLQFQVALISSHGHTTFHVPSKKMTAQIGDGAAIAAETNLPVVSDLRSLDIAFGGQGAPIVPVGEKLLLGNYDYFLNLGGIANISFNSDPYLGFDICAANRVLNMLANMVDKEYDDKGEIARSGKVNEGLLKKLNDLSYYHEPYPKSLANDFGIDIVFPMILDAEENLSNALRTYVEHIVAQTQNAMVSINRRNPGKDESNLLVTGGGAHNDFLVDRLKKDIKQLGIEVTLPGEDLINYKEAMIMAFIGVLRWRQEYNVLSSVTGASRDSIGGALWIGQEA